MNELDIIAGCKQGNTRAQKLLFDQHSEKMLLVCIRYVKNQADAEELMLNGFYKFYTQIDKYTHGGAGNLTAWLRKIMINECLMFLRKKGKLIMIRDHNDEAIANENIDDKLNAAELLTLITELPDGYRTIFNLSVIEEYTHKEIAILLNISEGTSKSQLSKARTMLQKRIRQKGGYNERLN